MPLSFLIRRNWLDTEMRVAINEAKVAQYAQEMKDGGDFPLPVVFVDHDEIFRIGDGFHRVLAIKENVETYVTVMVCKGGRREAFLHGIEANRQQKGLPFSSGDKEKCILTLLTDPETKKWTQTKIADTVGSSIAYVSQVCRKFNSPRPDTIIDKNGIIRSKSALRDHETAHERKEKAVALYANGTPKIEIARKLKIARWAVQRYIYDACNDKALETCPHCNGTGKVQSKRRPSEAR